MECHDCKKDIKNKYIKYKVGNNEFLKCSECFKKDNTLRNFRECDVYSRIVGFHSPVSRWNPGKTQEWLGRKTFEINC